MAENKKYFWLKLKETFFDDKQIRYLRKLPDGDKVVITYLKMQLKSLKTAGTIRYDRILPSCEEELALLLDEDINIIKFTIKALIQINAIEILEDNSIYMLAMQELIGKEGASAERVRRFRENKKLALQSNNAVTECNTESEKDIESEINQEKEIEKEIKSESELPKEATLTDVVNAYQKYIGKMEMKILNEMTVLIKENNVPAGAILDAIYKASSYGAKSWKYVCTILVNRKDG